MSSITELLSNEIYPALFHQLPEALPEFEFTRKADRYRSTNTLKVSGEQGNSKGKVEVLERAPFWIKDYRGGGCSIWDYIQERDSLSTNGEVIRRLAELAQISLPEQQLTEEESARIQQANFDAKLWEVVNGFFIDCLSGEKNQYANTPMAGQVRDYLTKPISKGGRGYSPSVFLLPGQDKVLDRDFPLMEVGYIPGTKAVREYLLSVGFNESQIFSLMNGLETSPEGRIGTQNILTFPYRDHAGRIRGMVFRSLYGTDFKYLYSQGLKRNQILFNLRAVAKDTDLSIVESPLDALHAAALGIKNITALGGSGDTLNTTQIDLAIRYGVKRITLMLDNDSADGIDRAGVLGTDKAVALLQKHYPNLRVFVGQYPETIKDLDELLSKEGVEGYQRAKDNALESWRYQLDRLFAKYNRLVADGGESLTAKQVTTLIDDAIALGDSLPLLDRGLFDKAFLTTEGIQEIGVTEQAITDIRKERDQRKAKQLRDKEAQSLLHQAKSKIDSGDTSAALDLLQTKAREIKRADKADLFSGLCVIRGEQHLKDAIRNRPEPLDSGFTIRDEPIKIPAAAVSIIAAATSHGKSIMLANLALSLAENYPSKTFHIFSYEVDEERYLMNLLNAFIGDDELAHNNRESIEHYFRGKRKIQGKYKEFDLFESPVKAHQFDQKRAEFFRTLIDTGRIKVHYVTYDSNTLVDAVHYLNQSESVGAILVDYVQLIFTPAEKQHNSRQAEIKDMCIAFKDLVIDTGLPLIFAAQFNRDVSNLLQMHATRLGEAGDLERIADFVLGIWNNTRRPSSKLSASEEKIIDLRVGSLEPVKSWYVEVLKRRGGKVEVWDIWDYYPNAGKVSNSN